MFIQHCFNRFNEVAGKAIYFFYDGNSTFEARQLKWNKIPRWYYVSLGIMVIFLTTAVLSFHSIYNEPHYLRGSFFALCASVTFVWTHVVVIKRYKNFKIYEKWVQRETQGFDQLFKLKRLWINPSSSTICAKEIPKDVMEHIFSFLNAKDLGHAAQVSKQWYAHSRTNKIWNNLGRRKFPRWKEQKIEFKRAQSKRVAKGFDLKLTYLFFDHIYFYIAKKIWDGHRLIESDRFFLFRKE